MKNRFVSSARVSEAYRRLERMIRDPRVSENVLIRQFERATKLELMRREWVEASQRRLAKKSA
mgnify:CR=1 FL=1